MADYNELQQRLRDELIAIDPAIGESMVHPRVREALQTLADALMFIASKDSAHEALLNLKADKTITDNLYKIKVDKNITDDLYKTKADKTQTDDLYQTKADKTITDELYQIKADKTELDALRAKDQALEAQIANAGGVSKAEAQRLIDAKTTALGDELRTQDGILDTAIKALEVKIGETTGLPEADVRRIIGEILNPVAGELRTKDGALDSAIKALEVKIEETTGLPETDVRRIIGEILNPVADELRTRDGALDTAIKALEAKVEEMAGLPETDVRRIIGEILNPVADELRTRDGALDTAVKALEAKVEEMAGLPEADVPRIIGEILDPVANELRTQDGALDTAIKALEAKVEEMAGLPEADVRRIIGETLDTVSTELRNKDIELEGKIGAERAEIVQIIEDKIGAEAHERRIGDANTAAKITPEIWVESAVRKAGDALIPSIAAATALAAAALPRTDLDPIIDTKIAETKAQQAQTDGAQDEKIVALRTDVDALKALPKALTKQEILTAVQDNLKGDFEQIEGKIAQSKEDSKNSLAQSDAKEGVEFGKVRTEIQTEKAALTQLMDTKIAALEIPTDAEINANIEAHIDHFRTELDPLLDAKADQSSLETLRVEFFEQDENGPGTRLARVALIGTGIVGGLELRSDLDTDYIHLTPGVAVMPCSGLLITETDPYVFSHGLPILDGLGDDFFKKSDGSGYFEIWELLKPENPPATARSLTDPHPDDPSQSFLSDKVVILHLHKVSPSGPSSGTLETEIRYILMKEKDLREKLSSSDPCRSYWKRCSRQDDELSHADLWRCLHPEAQLPEIPLFRFGFFTEEECAPEDLDKTDFPTLANISDFYDTWVPIIEDAMGRIRKTFSLVIERYHQLLFPLFDAAKFLEALDGMEDKWTLFTEYNEHVKAPALPTQHFAQYFYDWMRDLIAAYHELRHELIDLMSDLRTALPMGDERFEHLLIGPAYQPDTNGLAPLWRDTFRQPPIYNGNAKRLETSRLYYRRFFKMIEGFYPDQYAPDGVLPDWCKNMDDDTDVVPTEPHFEYLRITPSKGYIHPLSARSIPFYYPLSNNPKSLHHYWNYERAKTLRSDYNLSYHANDAEDVPTYSTRREVVRPLYYTLDAYDSYRIEGHIGKEKVSLYPKSESNTPAEYPVYEAIQYLIRKHNLDIKVVKMAISELQSAGPANPPYKIGVPGKDEETANSFAEKILGAEHLAGVPKGGTFIIVLDDNGIAIADFALPYKVS